MSIFSNSKKDNLSFNQVLIFVMINMFISLQSKGQQANLNSIKSHSLNNRITLNIDSGAFADAKTHQAIRFLARKGLLTSSDISLFSINLISNESPTDKIINYQGQDETIVDNAKESDKIFTIVEQDFAGKSGGIVAVSEVNSKQIGAKDKYLDLKKDMPMIVINGVVKSYTDLKIIKPKDIKSMNILDSPYSIEKYAKAGSNGVVEIITK